MVYHISSTSEYYLQSRVVVIFNNFIQYHTVVFFLVPSFMIISVCLSCHFNTIIKMSSAQALMEKTYDYNQIKMMGLKSRVAVV